ncbi:ergothioneine biosynthesis protein EgtB [Dichotomicrobium thermohalophilum]|uniref:Ergothioneine biosynthesis protein EgtB n=1 Tax=Dichotomicrobium thermohalophilum TaxID=933063 RepID=A0A397Q0D8_9HYPH|nr:ergothioneine biosynthesis protein EgtB [Dichotomicrobium thermohalophilum]RIA54980.1 ergothioneine biosynthesis protein EgtB [Dichotomicrobium thermohalophilum]
MAIAEQIPREKQDRAARQAHLKQRLAETRELSTRLAGPLSDEDQTPQSMEDASPTKWHLAHTTWFFEELVLKAHAAGYREYDPRFAYCFNSYYETLGERHPRPRRGMLTRPTCAEVRAYRAYVDDAIMRMFEVDELSDEALDLIELGINHEQQHQELLLTDILSLFAVQPLRPAYRAETETTQGETPPLEWLSFDGGIFEVGHKGDSFAYDNEGPRHEQLIRPFKLAHRPVTNGEWLEFMADGGYETATLWLSDGWATVNAEGWCAPCYWEKRDGVWHQMGLGGLVPVDPARPVCHISYYEAQAFALWAGKRLPTEFEWEIASRDLPEQGNTIGAGLLRPAPTRAPDGTLQQMFGDVWEWTSSAYSAYPGFSTAPGAVGEYNGKFMCGQYVLRGGSLATPDGHVRRTYRNFFYPHQRWQFMGLRLASDA